MVKKFFNNSKKFARNVRPQSFKPRKLFMPVLFLGYLTTLIVYSRSFGRLTHELSYDDVSYAVSSGQRIRVLENQGVTAWLQSYFNNPPHSPTTELFGTIGLLMFGNSDTAFYAGQTLNIILVQIFLYFIFRTKYSQPKNSRIVLALVLTSPLFIMLALDARPDMFNGCMIALTCLTILSAAKTNQERSTSFKIYKRLIVLGGALSLLSKLTVIPQTLTLFLICIGVSIRLSDQKKRSEFSRWISSCFGLSLLVSSPVLALSFTRIYSYVYDAVFSSEKQIWTFSESESNFQIAITYFSPLWQRIGGIVTPLYLLLLCAFFLLLRRRMSFAIHGSILVLMTITFLILLGVRQKNEFFFSTMHAFALFGLADLMLQIYSANYRKQVRIIASVIAITSMVLTPLFIRFPASSETKLPNGLNQYIAKSLTHSKLNSEQLNVFVAFTGPVNATSLNWYEFQNGGRRNFVDDALNSNFDEVLSRATDFDLVIVSDSLRNESAKGLPSSDFQDELTDALFASGYGFVDAFPANKPHYYLLQRGKPSKFEVFVSKSVLGGIDGPFPDRGITETFRWSESNMIELCSNRIFNQGAKYRIPLMTELARELTIANDAFAQTFPHVPGVFQVNEIVLPSTSGSRCLRISVPADSGRVAISTSFGSSNGIIMKDR